MSPQDYSTLKRYATKMTDEEDDRNELVLQAWQASQKVGGWSSMLLLVNCLKLRARENSRSIAGRCLGGKSIRDVWHHTPVSLSTVVGNNTTLGDLLQSPNWNPFDATVVSQFVESLDDSSRSVLNNLTAGYTHREIRQRQGIPQGEFYRAIAALKARAKEYLLYLFEMNRRVGEHAVFVVRQQMGVIAYALPMDSLLNARQDKGIRRRLNGLYEYAKQISYLKDYAVDAPGAKAPKIDRLHLNSAKFRAMRKV